MLDKILIDCIKEQIKDPQFLYTIEWNDDILLESYSIQKLGKGSFYLCRCKKELSDNPLQTFYISEDRVKKRIEILRNERLGYVLNRQRKF